MVKITAPVRIDLSAGWTDADPFREKYGGWVLNGAINLRVSAELKNKELVTSLEKVPKNSGLGTSGALRSVYLCASNKGLVKNRNELIRKVWVFENEVINQRAGFQDQAAAIYGGVNLWAFEKGKGEKAKIYRVPVSKEKVRKLEKKLVLVYTGKRQSSDIHELVFRRYKRNISKMKEMKDIAKEMSKKIDNSDFMIKLMNRTWKLQKGLHKKIETPKMRKLQKKLRKYYCACRAAGAGGGGCMLFYTNVKDSFIRKVKGLSKEMGVKVIDFKFDWNGLEMEK